MHQLPFMMAMLKLTKSDILDYTSMYYYIYVYQNISTARQIMAENKCGILNRQARCIHHRVVIDC